MPLAQQSVPHLRAEAGRYEVARQAFTSAPARSTGAGAVAAARYGLAQKSADQVDAALSAAGVEAERLLASAPAPTVAPPTSLPAGPGGAVVTAAPRPRIALPPNALPQPVQAARVKPAAEGGLAVPSRFVGGRTFFQNGDQWLDARVQQAPQARQLRIQFNSAEYFDLVLKSPEVRPWLALGQNVQFVLGDTVYTIYE